MSEPSDSSTHAPTVSETPITATLLEYDMQLTKIVDLLKISQTKVATIVLSEERTLLQNLIEDTESRCKKARSRVEDALNRAEMIIRKEPSMLNRIFKVSYVRGVLEEDLMRLDEMVAQLRGLADELWKRTK